MLKHLLLTFAATATLCVSGIASAQTEIDATTKQHADTFKILVADGKEAVDAKHGKKAELTTLHDQHVRAMVVNGNKTEAVHVRLYRNNVQIDEVHLLPFMSYSYIEDQATAGEYHLVLDSQGSKYRGVLGLAG